MNLPWEWGFVAGLVVLFLLAINTLPSALPHQERLSLQASFGFKPETALPVLFTGNPCPATPWIENLMAQYHYPHQSLLCPGDKRCSTMAVMGKSFWGLGPLVSTPFPTMVLPNGDIVRGGKSIAIKMKQQGFIPENVVFM
jgi:hypothetical protein